MFKKRRRPTPALQIPPPYNPITGEHASLRTDGIMPYCAMMQVAAEDTYEDYVICRGFDPRVPYFVDYEEGDSDKPGISVAKPFGNRVVGKYNIGEIYPALLPIQGTATHIPPSPTAVDWRLGQNPGVVNNDNPFNPVQPGGQPDELSDTIELLVDHNEKIINWLMIDSSVGGDTFFIFQLADPWVGRKAMSVIYQLDGENIGDLHSAGWVYDPLMIFAELDVGERGYCFYQNGKYYTIQAPCPEDGFLSSSSSSSSSMVETSEEPA